MNREYSVTAPQVRTMFGRIAPRYDLTNSVLSLGIHKLWKRKLVNAVAAMRHSNVLDLCTGTGDVAELLRMRKINSTGLDFSSEMLKIAEGRVKDRGTRFRYIQADALLLPFKDSSYDAVTIAFGIRNLESLTTGLKEIQRVIKPGGTLHILEFGQPRGKVWASIFNWYSAHLLPVIGGMLTGDMAAYRYLPKTSQEFPCADRFCSILEEIGYSNTDCKTLSGGIAYLYSARRD